MYTLYLVQANVFILHTVLLCSTRLHWEQVTWWHHCSTSLAFMFTSVLNRSQIPEITDGVCWMAYHVVTTCTILRKYKDSLKIM